MKQTEIPEEHIQQDELESLEELDLPTYDFKQHIGEKTTIEKVTVQTGEYGKYILVESKSLGTLGEGDDAKNVRASQIFGLVENPPGKWGWGAESKLGKFLDNNSVEHPSDMIGVAVTVQMRVAKDGREFLTFI